MRLKLCNLYPAQSIWPLENFSVRGYTFALEPWAQLRQLEVFAPSGRRQLLRNHRVTATVTFSGRQEDTILNMPGRRGPTRKRQGKLLDDILLLLSLLTGHNVVLASGRNYTGFPVLPRNCNKRVY